MQYYYILSELNMSEFKVISFQETTTCTIHNNVSL